MNLRPRCCEWLPLATQQLRLRNLARVQGLNIECSDSGCVGDDELLIYYTLHADKASEAFYTSEALPQRHQHQKWAEIYAGDVWRKSNAQCVCVKVWARYQPTKRARQLTETEEAMTGPTPAMEPQSALTQRLANVCLTPHKLPRPPELLFSWGVYFSGLIPMAPLTLDKCRANCLIFQLNGEYFTSPTMVSAKGLQEQLKCNYQRKAASVAADNEAFANNNDNIINSPQVSRSSSPVLGHSDRELLRMTTMRYMQISCNAHEVRRSYNLEQLLKLQRVQRTQQQRLREAAELRTDIARLSVHCITRNELRYKPRTTSSSSSPYANQHLHHSMGRTLSVLLAEQLEIAPLTLYNAQQLQRQIETLRCQRRLLEQERQTFVQCNERQRLHLQQLRQHRAALKQQLDQQRAQLEQQSLELRTQVQQQRTQREAKWQIIRQMKRRQSTLVMELQEIYNIQSVNEQRFSICGIAFPPMEQYASDARHIANAQLLENVSPLAVSAALGYVAHLVQMLAIIMDRPLRNPIHYEPSRTRITDQIKDMSYASRDFPLYTRSILPSQPTKYAIYLLRQNVAQLCYDFTGRRELKNTFGNLLELFETLRKIEGSQRAELAQALDELDSAKSVTLPHVNGLGASAVNQQLSQSHSSVDMNHVPMPTTAPIAKDALLQLLPPGMSQALAIEGYASTQRICRSVGSYSDGDEDEFRPILEHSYSNSDSKITLQTERS